MVSKSWKVLKFTKIKPVKNYYTITSKNFSGEEKTIETKTIIIATGIHPRSLNIPGEKNTEAKVLPIVQFVMVHSIEARLLLLSAAAMLASNQL
jgi:pyruvate/2-oxoglutarate dehydrogenase complex dihydrolipoamide dehydrogenase (E3) component